MSPLYDVNPDIYGEYLSLNVDGDHSSIDFELAVESAPYYGIEENEVLETVNRIKEIVRDNWRTIAGKYGINRGEIQRMSLAFRECEK